MVPDGLDVGTDAEEGFVSEAVAGYLSYLAIERGRAQNTIESYARDLLSFEAHLGRHQRNVFTAEEADVESYVASLRTTAHPRSIQRALSAIRGLYAYLAESGQRDSSLDPVGELRVRVPDRLPKALAVDEVLALIDSVGDATPHDLRDRAIIELLYGSGLRVSELCSLEWIRLDLDERLVRVVGKGDKERVVPISTHAAAALHAMRDAEVNERSRRSRYVFASRGGAPLTRQGVWYLLKRRGAAVGIAQVLTPHVLRHSCATHMIQGGADLRVVQELLGHVDLSTTQIYTRITIDHLVEVFRSSHPRDRVGFGERRR